MALEFCCKGPVTSLASRVFPASAGVACVLLAASNVCLAQEQGELPRFTPLEERCISLGSAGLLMKYSSYGTFGAVQNRIGQSRSAIEVSRLPGRPAEGYTDSSSQLILPVDVITAVPGTASSFLKLGASANINRGSERLTHVDVDTFRTEAQYLWSPTAAGFVGVGAFVEGIDIDMHHNGSSVDNDGRGLRADVVRRFGAHWGFAARVEHTWIDQAVRSPIPGGRVFAVDQDVRRLYSQADLVGTYTKETCAWLPQGYLLRPLLGLNYMNTRFETARSNLGTLVSGTVGQDDSYVSGSTALRLERAVSGPALFAPFAEFGLEHEFTNDLDAKVSDPDIAHSAVGFSSTLGRNVRLDIEYSRYDGLRGRRRAQSLTVHVGASF